MPYSIDLYPALYRLENRQQAKYYGLTANGKGQLRSGIEPWSRLSDAIGSVLDARPDEV